MSPFNEKGKIWMNGQFVPWKEANIHIASHVIHYGSSVFEGFRTYSSRKGSVVFRLDAHTQRMFHSCKIYRMIIPYSEEEFNRAVIETIKANEFEACYVRPLVYRGYGSLGVDPTPNPIECAILVWEWGKYLGEAALEEGVDVCVSSWNRVAPNTFPTVAKAGANYMNSQLIKMEANINGYIEGIALNAMGYVSEGSGENIFVVRKGIIYTPPLSSSILPGITRDSVLQIAQDLGFSTREEEIPRDFLYTAEEVFFTGSAAEITPIRTIDRMTIGNGSRGPVTKTLQDEFFAIIDGKKADRFNWLTVIE